MFGSSTLEVAIGIIFVYLLLSLICSAINEMIASITNMRGEILFEGIKNLLNDPTFTGLAQKLYNHGLIDGISQASKDPKKPNRRPSYVASKTFTLSLLDILSSDYAMYSWETIAARRKTALDAVKASFDANPRDPGIQKTYYEAQHALQKAQEILAKVDRVKEAYYDAESASSKVSGPKDIAHLQTAKEQFEKALTLGRLLAAELPDPLENIQSAVSALPMGHTRQSLLVLIEKTKQAALVLDQASTAAHKIEILQANIEQWFDDAMDRVSGWYKRWTQKIILVIAAILVLVINADTIMLVKRFVRDDALRASIVAVADKAVQDDASDPTTDQLARERLLEEAGKLTLPLGWIANPEDPYKAEQVPNCGGIKLSQCMANWGLKLLGLFITIMATQQGAPFWFDLLGKVTNLRAAGKKPDQSDNAGLRPATVALAGRVPADKSV